MIPFASRLPWALSSSWLLLGVCSALPVQAQTGVSDDRVSLPDGPGSVEGVGDNVSINPNMGAMSHSLPMELPAGHAGATAQDIDREGGIRYIHHGYKAGYENDYQDQVRTLIRE